MKLLIIRHGDPDYYVDSLTEKGWREAECLSKELSRMEVTDFYVSPYGRAKDTASLTLQKMNRTAEELPWLTEIFDSKQLGLSGQRTYRMGLAAPGLDSGTTFLSRG